MNSSREYVIGVHHALNRTQAICLHRSGEVAAVLERSLPRSKPEQDAGDNSEERMQKRRQAAVDNIRAVMGDLIAEAGITPDHIAAVTAAMMELQFSQDNEWANEATKLQGLLCPRQHVGVFEAAHAGALALSAGIAVLAWPSQPPERHIAPVARTQNGRVTASFELGGEAAVSRYDIAVHTIHRMLCGFAVEADRELVTKILTYWQAKNIRDLLPLVKTPDIHMPPSSDPRLDQLADVVISYAERGIPLAEFVCRQAIVELSRCLKLLAAVIEQDYVPVTFTSSLFQVPFMRRQVEHELANMPRFKLEEPRYSACVGACLLAMERAGFPITEAVHDRLRQDASVGSIG